MKRYSFFFKDTKPFVKLMMLICIFMVFTSISGFIMLFANLQPLLAQAISQIIMFGGSAIVWGIMFESSSYKFMETKKNNTLYYIALSILLVFIATPFIDGIGIWNDGWDIKSGEAFRQMEESASEIMKGFLSNTTPLGLTINIIVIALLPAIMEEVFFRGAMQRTMINLVKYRFLGILLTSIIFSLLHFQLFSCIPRVFLGLFLGYLYVISQNIIVPIIFHFINNLTVVVGSYLFYSNLIEFDINKLGSVYNPLLFIISILLIGSIFIYEKKKAKKIQIE
ncbi:MAG: type II CAAX endopeptidase family protein [Bacteroidales bacterium]|nr:type II CAAX endopeptidase family protein [Bacteroidales bacterium]MDD4684233.1 type II CAAX endopeptidase family protein [Bacteroidales bacterium]